MAFSNPFAMREALYRIAVTALVVIVFAAAMHSSSAGTPKNFFQNSDLNDGNNYSPVGLPSSANDVLLTTSAAALNLSGTDLSMGSLNQTNDAAYTISNNTSGSTSSFVTLAGGMNSIGANPNDLIFLGGATSSLTLQGANGGTGTGTLIVSTPQPGNLDVAQANATLNISATFNTQQTIAKTGAGTLNLSSLFGSNSVSFEVDEGTINFLPGASIPNVRLYVNNINPGSASAVVVNMETSIYCRGLVGTIAPPSSGTSTATVNLMGAATELTLFARTGTTSLYQGDITGEGSVTVSAPSSAGGQIFAGHNTYSGTTTISGGTLKVDGDTSGQGNYTILGSVFTHATLSGSGTIGLASNGIITLGGGTSQFSYLTAGDLSAAGTLHVITSGTGKVVFSDNSIFLADVGAAGLSDLLAITGGRIDLTSSTDTLSLNGLSGAFDGSNYTLATFSPSGAYGVFNTVTGLPGNYTVVYNQTSIMLVGVPEPTVLAIFSFGVALLFIRFVCRRIVRSSARN